MLKPRRTETTFVFKSNSLDLEDRTQEMNDLMRDIEPGVTLRIHSTRQDCFQILMKLPPEPSVDHSRPDGHEMSMDEKEECELSIKTYEKELTRCIEAFEQTRVRIGALGYTIIK